MTTSQRRTSTSIMGTVTLLAAALIAPATGALGTAPASADEIGYGTTVQGRTFETFAQIPAELNQGVPSSTVYLDHQGQPRCEIISGVYDAGLVAEEYAQLSSGGNYQNPTLARAVNPPGVRPAKVEYTTFPGGPSATADCISPDKGVGSATFGGMVTDGFSIESATTRSNSQRIAGDQAVVTESVTALKGIKLAETSIRSLESWLKVEWRPERDPLVSYRIALHGVSNGDDSLFAAGGQGLVLSGQNVAGADLVKQFNQQSKEHGAALEQLGTYGFHILEPRTYTDSGSSRAGIDAPALDASWAFTARAHQTGHRQGFRLAVVRATGRIG